MLGPDAFKINPPATHQNFVKFLLTQERQKLS